MLFLIEVILCFVNLLMKDYKKDMAPIKSSIKPYHVQQDLELDFELELELEERLNNDLAQERYYIQASR